MVTFYSRAILGEERWQVRAQNPGVYVSQSSAPDESEAPTCAGCVSRCYWDVDELVWRCVACDVPTGMDGLPLEGEQR
jgi:hypothetical protein